MEKVAWVPQCQKVSMVPLSRLLSTFYLFQQTSFTYANEEQFLPLPCPNRPTGTAQRLLLGFWLISTVQRIFPIQILVCIPNYFLRIFYVKLKDINVNIFGQLLPPNVTVRY